MATVITLMATRSIMLIMMIITLVKVMTQKLQADIAMVSFQLHLYINNAVLLFYNNEC